ncbi:MAG: VOC family protein [Candidatus Binatus sp.]|uniref:VOC family protein n=1 Tax=Candidatus Binatus sp. TaxID=2811406 RepID=UPI0027180CFF|nr:VOC family protein [Candidatus Binatus sp.]MDO8431833.1 VOC family protein [Candidatus Binatus sp.]
MKGISHVAIGVSDMERALPFYRDLLGLEVMLDAVENVGRGKRRAVYMRWGNNSGFLVLSQTLEREPSGKPLRLHQVGLHHFAFWVDDLKERAEKLEQAGVRFLVPPYEADAIAYGEKGGGKVLTTLFEDPDGTILQFDQRLH